MWNIFYIEINVTLFQAQLWWREVRVKGLLFLCVGREVLKNRVLYWNTDYTEWPMDHITCRVVIHWLIFFWKMFLLIRSKFEPLRSYTVNLFPLSLCAMSSFSALAHRARSYRRLTNYAFRSWRMCNNRLPPEFPAEQDTSHFRKRSSPTKLK